MGTNEKPTAHVAIDSGTAATIRAKDLELVLAAAKMRRWNKGRTCQLCALTGCPTITLNCDDRLSRKASYREAVVRYGISPARVTPMQRGLISGVFDRVQRRHGRGEVLRTWGAGVKALRAEQAYVLNGGSAA